MWTKCKENGDIYLDRYEGWCATKQTAEMMAFCDFFGGPWPWCSDVLDGKRCCGQFDECPVHIRTFRLVQLSFE